MDEPLAAADGIEGRAVATVAAEHVRTRFDVAVITPNQRVEAEEACRSDDAGTRERLGGHA